MLKKQNKLLWGTLVLSLVLTALIIYVPVLRNLFSFTFIGVKELLTAVGLALVIIPIVEVRKLFIRK